MTEILALSGSLRAASTNTALLQAFADAAAGRCDIRIFAGLGRLPVFSPDQEGDRTPEEVLAFAEAVDRADGVVIACPEYVHAIPGGLKNAIDWLVSRAEIIDKPVALLHASHRGDDVLRDLRRVLGTVSSRFNPEVFARFELMKLAPEEIAARMREPEQRKKLVCFLDAFEAWIARSANET